jgi:hypothetical protein
MLPAVFTGNHRWFLYWTRWVKSTSSFFNININIPPIYIYVFLVVSSLRFFQLKLFNAFIISRMRAKYPSHFVCRNLITLLRFGEEGGLWSPSFYNFLHTPVSSSLTSIFSAPFFSNILSPCPVRNMREQVSRIYKTDTIIVSYIFISTFLDKKPEGERFWNE